MRERGYRPKVAERGRPLFTIGAVARMLDLAPATIRTWESRYGNVVPERSRGGQRLYSRDQVDQLRFVKDEVTSGRRPAEAHRLLAERVANGEGFSGARMRILLAETKFGAAEMLRQLIGTEGFDVVLASGPDSAGGSLDDVVTLAVVDSDDAGFDDLLRELKHRGASVRLLKQAGP
jgi:DNA-binding transcriptional MerR regulator